MVAPKSNVKVSEKDFFTILSGKKQIKENNSSNNVIIKKEESLYNNEDVELIKAEKKLVDKKTELIEINTLIDQIIEEKKIKKYSFLKKIKNMFNLKFSKNIQTGFLIFGTSSISVLYFLSFIFFILSITYNSGILWSLISLFAVSLVGVAFISLYHNSISKNIEAVEVKNITENHEITEEQLLRISMFFDEDDVKKIREINSQNGIIKLKDIVNIAKRKQRWILDNEEVILTDIKAKKVKDILDLNVSK